MEDTRSMYGNTLNVVSCRTIGYVAIMLLFYQIVKEKDVIIQ